MSQRNIKLVIAYDGSGYHGWQRQQADVATVQQTLEEVLVRVVKHPVSLRAAGRTDTGVHAAGQVANFFSDTPIPTERLAPAISARLPRDIRIRSSRRVPDDFDATRSARSKLYRYTVYRGGLLPVCHQRYCYHYYLPCRLAAMQQAADRLRGEHDFASFASAGGPRLTTVRRLLRCQVWQRYDWLYFDLEATGFLYHMVRNIVGTLLEIGRLDRSPEWIETVLAARQRPAAGPMVPPNGLCLQWVKYDRSAGAS
ncbi:MAG: tRNA pseudouridine(38-40) synthase TruA [Sedimentisphaerales bacterium]|nr:tRNA pseudouridine(38-40) synthase TruA [Sedimentisphaerales bacterium]